jgi:hypothetical protein
MATVTVVPVTMTIAWFVARLRMQNAIGRALESTNDVRLDVARLEHAPPLTRLKARVDGLELHSVWAPLMGWALTAPLSIHLAIALVLGWTELPRHAKDYAESFDIWILCSIVLMGIGHAVLCKMAVRFARQLQAWSPLHADAKEPSIWAPYGWTMAGACVPGVVLYGVPVMIAAVTSLFIPITFGVVKRRIISERTQLAMLEMSEAPSS